MKRAIAIEKVLGKLRVIKEDLSTGKDVSSLDFLALSEIFKFKIEPKSDRFTATCLDEASKTTDKEKHLELVDDILETGDEDNDSEEEVNELIDFDGSMQSSKIPPGTENVKSLSSKKTTDDVVKGTRQAGTWSGGGHYFKRYYGESIEENDLSKTLGFDETQDMDAEETIEFFEKEHDMDTEEAKERAESMGKTENLDKKGENYQRLTEKERLKKISEDKVKKMLEVILSNKTNDGEIREQLPTISSTIIINLIKKLVKLLKAEGINDADSMCKKIKEYWDE
tara:strand:- start:2302 stop:3150 length:849 start_codon:yes stop_codon:yes gene_type:complete